MIEITTSAPRRTGRRAASPRSPTPTTSAPTCRARLHRERDGAPAAGAPADRPVQRCGRPRARRLRTPLSPDDSFLDDPLRMLRAAGCRQFGLTPDPRFVDAIERLRHRLEIVSAERIRDELSKLLLLDDPTAGLWMLAETGLADEFLPELNAMRLEQDGPHPQGRARPHDRGDPQHPSRAGRAPRRAVPRRGQAEDAPFARRRGELPPPRGGRGADGGGAAARCAIRTT